MVNDRHYNRYGFVLRQGLAFVSLFFLLQILWQYCRGTTIERAIIHDATVKPAALLIDFLSPTLHVSALDFHLNAIGGGLDILNGCEGMDALLLLVSAFAVAPISWRARGWGVLFGFGIVFVANQFRILILFYVSRTDRILFEQLHATVAPIAVILAVSGYFYAWLFHSTRHAAVPV